MDDMNGTGDLPAPAASPETGGGAPSTPPVSSSPSNGYGGHSNAETFQPTQDTYLQPPQSWKKEVAERHWSRLDRDLRAYVHDREAESHKKITELGERAKRLDPYERIAQEHADHFEKFRVTPEQALAEHIRAHQYLEQNPLAFLIDVGKRYGIDLELVIRDQSPQRVAELEGQLRQIQEAEQRKHAETAQAEIQKLATDTARFPYFEQVRGIMASFMQGGHAPDLETAYQMAVRASPQISERIQADERAAYERRHKEQAAKQEAAARAKAAEAQRAAKLNVRSVQSHNSVPKTMSQTIAALAEKHYGRG